MPKSRHCEERQRRGNPFLFNGVRGTPRGCPSKQTRVEVFPIWVGAFDQCDFFRPGTSFKLFLSADRVQHGGVDFKIDQRVDAILPGETRGQVIFVLIDTLNDVRGNAHVERAARLACQDVDSGLHSLLWRGFAHSGWIAALRSQ